MISNKGNRYEIFLKVAELGSFTQAAEALHYTQSGVSHAIAALEKEIGFALFVRQKVGVSLTANGQRLLLPVQRLANEQRNLSQTVADINEVIAGTLRLGAFGSAFAQWLPGIIEAFQEAHPQVEFELLDGDYDEITDWIKRGRVDCGFLAAPVPEDFFFHPLIQDPLVVVMSENHPLAKKNTLTKEDIALEPLITWVGGGDNDVRTALGGNLRNLNIRYRLNSDLTVLAMVERGHGICVLPELAVNYYIYQLRMIPLAPPRYRRIGIASAPYELLPTVTRTFLDFLIENEIQSFESI